MSRFETRRVISKSYNTSDPPVTYTYDKLRIPNGRGRLYSVSNSLVTATYNAYRISSFLGRPFYFFFLNANIQIERTLFFIPETNTGSYDPISYNYDALGNILSKTVGSAAMAHNYQWKFRDAHKIIKFYCRKK